MIGTLATLVRPGGALFISTLNRNLKSFLMAIVGAEYVLKLIPRGTHEYERLIRPAGARPLGTLRGAVSARARRHRAQSVHGTLQPEPRHRRELPCPPGAMTEAVNPLLLSSSCLAALLVGAMLGFLVAQLRAARRIEAVRIELEAARVRLESTTRQEADRISLLEQSEARLRAAFDSLAGETLRSNSELFLRMARESLGRDQAVAQSAAQGARDRDRATRRADPGGAAKNRGAGRGSRARASRRVLQSCGLRSRHSRTARRCCNGRPATSSPRCVARRCADAGVS